MALEFKSGTARRDPITFKLDDDEFTFTPPKLASAVLEGLETGDDFGASLDWLRDGLPEDQSALIVHRLKDQNDTFDITDLGPIIEALIAKVTGRPTSPSRGSRRRR